MCGHTIFYHRLYESNVTRGEKGVTIMILPNFFAHYEDSTDMPAANAPDDDGNLLCSRYLEITLKFKRMFKVKKGAFSKNKHKKVKLTFRFVSIHTSRHVQELLILPECLIEKL